MNPPARPPALGSTGSPNQVTSYGYNALDNLTRVTQGTQTRTFAYDSLSRLTSGQKSRKRDHRLQLRQQRQPDPKDRCPKRRHQPTATTAWTA